MASSLSSTPGSSARRLLLPFAGHDSSAIGLGGGDGDGSAKVVGKFGAVAVTGVGRRVGGRSFASTGVLHELVLPFVIHEIVGMEDHAHIRGEVFMLVDMRLCCQSNAAR